MAKGSGFFKGEKKKKKVDKERTGGVFVQGTAPTYTMPDVITKKKSE